MYVAVKIFLFGALLFGIVQQRAAAQTTGDSSRIVAFSRPSSTEIFAGDYSRGFRISPADHGLHNVYRLQANTSAYAGVGIYYKWLNLALVTGVPGTALAPRDPDVKVIGLALTTKSKRLGLTGGFERVHGMLLQGAEDTGFERIPALRFVNVFGMLTYIWNPDRFSYRAATSYSYLQRCSGGSFMLRFNPSYNLFRVQGGASQGHPFLEQLGTSRWISAFLEGGYGYNFVSGGGHWSIAPVLLVGPGLQKDVNNNLNWHTNLGWAAQLTAGYNGNRFYAYTSATGEWARQHLKGAGLLTYTNDVSVTVGLRFGSRKTH